MRKIMSLDLLRIFLFLLAQINHCTCKLNGKWKNDLVKHRAKINVKYVQIVYARRVFWSAKITYFE